MAQGRPWALARPRTMCRSVPGRSERSPRPSRPIARPAREAGAAAWTHATSAPGHRHRTVVGDPARESAPGLMPVRTRVRRHACSAPIPSPLLRRIKEALVNLTNPRTGGLLLMAAAPTLLAAELVRSDHSQE